MPFFLYYSLNLRILQLHVKYILSCSKIHVQSERFGKERAIKAHYVQYIERVIRFFQKFPCLTIDVLIATVRKTRLLSCTRRRDVLCSLFFENVGEGVGEVQRAKNHTKECRLAVEYLTPLEDTPLSSERSLALYVERLIFIIQLIAVPFLPKMLPVYYSIALPAAVCENLLF